MGLDSVNSIHNLTLPPSWNIDINRVKLASLSYSVKKIFGDLVLVIISNYSDNGVNCVQITFFTK